MARQSDAERQKRYRQRHPERHKAATRDYHKRHPHKRKSNKYGISELTIARMLVAQEGRCDICHVEASLHVDHDHSNGLVRAMLCRPCNQAIGQMADNPDRMRAAADYIERFAGRENPQLRIAL